MSTTKKLFVLDEIEDEKSLFHWKETLHPVESAWFKLCEGEKKGLKFCMPLKHPSYSEDLEKSLEELSEGDKVRLSVKPNTKRKVSFLIHSVEERLSN